jgi:subtilase family serine protease
LSRRAALIGAAVALATASTGIATAAPSSTGIVKSEKRVCALPTANVAQCHAHVVTNAKTAKPLATATWTRGYGDDTLRSVYGPGNSTATIAIVDAYAHPDAQADLNAYRAAMDLGPITLTQYNQSGGPISTVTANVGWGQEEMLDLEMATAICPTCPLIYVGANSNAFTDLAAAVNQARSKGADVISNSYGGNEFSQETSNTYSGAYNAPGAVLTVSSGDSGYGVSFPAAAANVVAVGGTNLKVSGGVRTSETVWSGAGSGCSAYVGKPSWQSSTVSGCSKRMVADVAAVADPATGVAVYDSYGSTGGNNWYVFGGTSVAAPIIAGIYASYGATGDSNEVSNLWNLSGSGLFDVTVGNNGRCTKGRKPGPARWCNGAAGYDGPTGWGTPNGDDSAIF